MTETIQTEEGHQEIVEAKEEETQDLKGYSADEIYNIDGISYVKTTENMIAINELSRAVGEISDTSPSRYMARFALNNMRKIAEKESAIHPLVEHSIEIFDEIVEYYTIDRDDAGRLLKVLRTILKMTVTTHNDEANMIRRWKEISSILKMKGENGFALKKAPKLIDGPDNIY